MEKWTLLTSSEKKNTDIYIDSGLSFLGRFCKGIAPRGAIVADQTVAHLFTSQIEPLLAQEGLSFDWALFDGGEKAKTRETKQRLEDELLKKKLGKDSWILVLGGGVATDLGGFLASTYMRGVPLILVPTTLLAMVDAAIGGKTGIDTPFGKNLIGAFYPAQAIFINTNFLKTLPDREWINGLGEILKYGLIANAPLWDLCEEAGENWKREAPRWIPLSIQTKLDIVEKDPEEKGLRRILNFGHTVAHALEYLSHYQIPHGEAVLIGCWAESYLSYKLGYLAKKDFERISHVYKKFKFTSSLPKGDLFEAMKLDKKAKENEPRFVLIDQIGHTLPFEGTYCRTVPKKEIDAMTDWLRHI